MSTPQRDASGAAASAQNEEADTVDLPASGKAIQRNRVLGFVHSEYAQVLNVFAQATAERPQRDTLEDLAGIVKEFSAERLIQRHKGWWGEELRAVMGKVRADLEAWEELARGTHRRRDAEALGTIVARARARLDRVQRAWDRAVALITDLEGVEGV